MQLASVDNGWWRFSMKGGFSEHMIETELGGEKNRRFMPL